MRLKEKSQNEANSRIENEALGMSRTVGERICTMSLSAMRGSLWSLCFLVPG